MFLCFSQSGWSLRWVVIGPTSFSSKIWYYVNHYRTLKQTFVMRSNFFISLTYQVEIFLWPNSLRWSACILEIFLFNILTIFNGNFQKISRPRLGSHTIGLVTHWLDCPGNQPRPLSLVEIPPSSVIWSIKGWDRGVATPALLCHKDSKPHTSSAPLWRLPWERCGPGVESGGESYKCKWGGHITTGWFTLWG